MGKIKHWIRVRIDRMKMFFEFYHDYKDYKRWNYNNPKVKTLGAQEAKILRQTHIIEKGLSLSSPRKGFGKAKIDVLFSMLDEYVSLGFDTTNVPFQNALLVLEEYIEYQKKLDYEDPEIEKRLENYKQYKTADFDSGILRGTAEDIKKMANRPYPEFFRSRHSMRQFSNKEIDFEDIKKAVALAQKAPTACNRQASRVYYYDDEDTNKALGYLIAGNTGFEEEVKKYLVITADMSAFYDSFERNQIYVEAGLFAMALMEALHYYGIASCALQNGEYYKKNLKFKEICKNIPENEKIILFIAIGYYKDEFNYAVSKRKDLEKILIKK